MKSLIAMLLFSIWANLSASEDIDMLDFHYLNDSSKVQRWNGKRVKIRGFLYSNQKNEWILSSEPNLKSCCVGSKEKAKQQIFLIDAEIDKHLNNLISEVEGIFKYDSTNPAGRHYFLEEVIVNKDSKQISNLLWIGFGFIFVSGWVILKRKIKG